jgi:hypothetical protein
MRFYGFLIVIGLVAFFGWWLWHDVDGLVLVADVQKGFYNSYTIGKDGKPITAFSFDFMAQNQGIYKYFSLHFAIFTLLGLLIGIVAGYFIREPMDEFDFERVKTDAEAHKKTAWEEANKAKDALKTAESRAREAAQSELENERISLEYQKSEAEKERRAAIKAQQEAEAAVRKARIERTDALRVADNATRKKNAAYSAAERFKRRLEKTA